MDEPILNIRRTTACVIGNGGLGDTIVYMGIVNFLATKYDNVIVACMKKYYEQLKHFFRNDKIRLYPIDMYETIGMSKFEILMRTEPVMHDVYAFGHYGSFGIDYDAYWKKNKYGKIVKIIYDYPLSYYEDIEMPISIMTKYFCVEYPKDILDIYDELLNNHSKYTIVHQEGSNASFDIVEYNKLNIDDELTIDVNKNLYNPSHKYYEIASKFVNLPSIVYYTKLVENATSLYLLDSCIHAIALVVNVDKAHPRICYQREYRMKYGLDKFEYLLLVDNVPLKIELPLPPVVIR